MKTITCYVKNESNELLGWFETPKLAQKFINDLKTGTYYICKCHTFKVN